MYEQNLAGQRQGEETGADVYLLVTAKWFLLNWLQEARFRLDTAFWPS
jgi:hypothetical protein